MKIIKLLFVLLLLMVLLITFTPLNLYYDQISKKLYPLKLEQISGSVIKGSAQKLNYMGINLGHANWLIYPSSYNTVSMDWSIKDSLYDFSGIYKKSSQTEQIQDLNGSFDWELISKYVNVKYGNLSGYIKLDFKNIEFKNNAPERIIGTAVAKDLKLIKPSRKDLGEIEVVFTSDNPVIIVGQVNSKSNVLNVSGAIYIHKNHRWEVKLTLLPMPGEYEIEYAIQNIGDKRAGGGRSLNLAGFY